jgi:hypothetical protein
MMAEDPIVDAEIVEEVPVPTHTEEARTLLAEGVIRPGDKALDLPPESMSDREMIAETLIHARNTRDTVNALVEAIMSSPLGVMIGGGKMSGPLGMMFGNNANGG